MQENGTLKLAEAHTRPVAYWVESTLSTVTNPDSAVLAIQGVLGGLTTPGRCKYVQLKMESDIILPTVHFRAYRLALRWSILAQACLPGHSLTQA